MVYQTLYHTRMSNHTRMSSSHFSVTNSLIRNKTQRTKCITVVLLGFAIFAILLAYVAFGDEDVSTQPSIKVAYVIFRHGDRNPTETYPTDPYNDLKYWNGGWGALTNKGKLQMYNLGAYLKSRYGNLLGEVYSPNRLLVRSSDNDRCLMSAGALLAGLQPPAAVELWLPGFNWQPIPIHATPRSLDKLIVVKKKCPHYDRELKNAYETEEIRKINKDNADLYQFLSTHTGQNISSVLDVEFLFNTLEIEEKNDMELPEWTKSVYPGRMKRLSEISLAVFTHTLTMKRLMGGPLINDMKDKMLKKRGDALNSTPQVFLISGHDVTVINLLRTIGSVDLLKPDIGAALLFELHAGPAGLGDTKDYLKLFYMNTSSSSPTPMPIHGCGEPCSLDEFVSLFSQVTITPNEWEEECNTL